MRANKSGFLHAASQTDLLSVWAIRATLFSGAAKFTYSRRFNRYFQNMPVSIGRKSQNRANHLTP